MLQEHQARLFSWNNAHKKWSWYRKGCTVETRVNQFNLRSLKCLLANYYQFDKPIILHTDANDFSIGGVFSQIQDGQE